MQIYGVRLLGAHKTSGPERDSYFYIECGVVGQRKGRLSSLNDIIEVVKYGHVSMKRGQDDQALELWVSLVKAWHTRGNPPAKSAVVFSAGETAS